VFRGCEQSLSSTIEALAEKAGWIFWLDTISEMAFRPIAAGRARGHYMASRRPMMQLI
jgi:hypothetical protein